jgi:hypothetical protein
MLTGSRLNPAASTGRAASGDASASSDAVVSSDPAPSWSRIVWRFVGSMTREKCYIRGFREDWHEAVVLQCVLIRCVLVSAPQASPFAGAPCF